MNLVKVNYYSVCRMMFVQQTEKRYFAHVSMTLYNNNVVSKYPLSIFDYRTTE